jgi:proteic killer suppression protein
MIRSFRNKGLQQFYTTANAKKLSVPNTRRVAVILRALAAAIRPKDMDLPGLRFHALTGQDKGRYAVDASANWRITFGWIDNDATDVDLEDYH